MAPISRLVLRIVASFSRAAGSFDLVGRHPYSASGCFHPEDPGQCARWQHLSQDGFANGNGMASCRGQAPYQP